MLRRFSGALAVVVAVAAFALFLATFGSTFGSLAASTNDFEFDLAPFYCGGETALAGGDPYRAEPLGSCERRVAASLGRVVPPVVPDPLPPYDQAAFGLVSRVPFGIVYALWPILECATFLASALVLSRLVRIPFLVVGSALVVSDFLCSMVLGQIVPVAIFGIVLAGFGLERSSRAVVAAGLACAMLEPHLGLPAVLAVAIAGRGFRTAAWSALAVLALVSAFAMPLGTIVEYVTQVGSAHALSEINNQDQFSLAYALHLLGLSETQAALLAILDYVAMLVAGIVCAKRAASAFGPATLVFGPVAFVLLGGPFVHVTQMAAALPAVLLIAGRVPRRTIGAAAVLLAIPWASFVGVLGLLPIAAGALFVTAWHLFERSAVRAGLFVAGALTIEACATLAILTVPKAAHAPYARTLPSDLPEMLWKTIVDSQAHQHVALSLIAKIPTEVAVAIVIVAIVREAFRRRVPMLAAAP